MISGAVVPPLLDWYAAAKRDLPWRHTRDPYRIWVSEIMLQQTRVEAVRGYYNRFMEALPDVQSLAQAEEPLYLKLWEGLGYYSRVRNLHRAAVLICEEYSGEIPSTYEELIRLPGIGDYTAGAVASIAFGERVPAVDGNVLRVVTRLLNDSRPITDQKVKTDLRGQVAEIVPEGEAGTFNQAIMELGATVCVPNGAPKCTVCPFQGFCAACQLGTAAMLPVKQAKKPRRIEPRTVFLICCGGMTALRRRPEKGLLRGMWELPAAEEALSPAQARAQLAQWGVEAGQLLSLKPAKHIFSHVEWHMTGYYMECGQRSGEFTWVTADQLREEYALPSAFRPFLEVLG